ncbi:unnamed protein product [Cladocopium goreaui]|uniref:Uncharacterized protein n=1 Tax=Cladocopium goreaui TaxID=2562237 RepID=A0A9P1G7C7_9DINO|nr:unnamed protein product [Cladocopium goreaui]
MNYVAGLEPRAHGLFAAGDSQRDAQEAYSFIVDRLVKEDEKLLDMLQGWKQIELFCDKCDTRQEQWEPFFFLDLEISGESLQEIQHMSSQSSLFSIVALQPGVSRCLQEGRHA